MTQHARADAAPIAPIAFIDVAAQRRRLGGKIDAAVARVLDHCQFILGPEVRALEQALAKFCGARHVVTCASGTDALALVLMAVSGQPYRPRFDSLERLFNALAEGKLGGGATLHGCHIRPSRKDFASFSLLVRPESPRKTGSSANKGA